MGDVTTLDPSKRRRPKAEPRRIFIDDSTYAEVLRPPPHHLHVERTVLATLADGLVSPASTGLEADDFFSPDHHIAFDHLTELAKRGALNEEHGLRLLLASMVSDLGPNAGNLIADLARSTVAVGADLRKHVGLIRSLSRRRKALPCAVRIDALLREPETDGRNIVQAIEAVRADAAAVVALCDDALRCARG